MRIDCSQYHSYSLAHEGWLLEVHHLHELESRCGAVVVLDLSSTAGLSASIVSPDSWSIGCSMVVLQNMSFVSF